MSEEILRRVRRYSSANKDIPFNTPLFIYSATTPFFVFVSGFFFQPKSHILIMSRLVTKEHSYSDILKGSMAQTQNKNQKNPTHEKPVPATVLPNNLDTETKTSDCTPKEIYVEIIKMSSPSQNITPHPSNFQGTPAMPMPMGYEQFQPPSSNLNANNS